MAAHDDASLEGEEEVLADGLDALELRPSIPSTIPSAAARGCGASTATTSPSS
jgi:hypothetical protein